VCDRQISSTHGVPHPASGRVGVLLASWQIVTVGGRRPACPSHDLVTTHTPTDARRVGVLLVSRQIINPCHYRLTTHSTVGRNAIGVPPLQADEREWQNPEDMILLHVKPLSTSELPRNRHAHQLTPHPPYTCRTFTSPTKLLIAIYSFFSAVSYSSVDTSSVLPTPSERRPRISTSPAARTP